MVTEAGIYGRARGTYRIGETAKIVGVVWYAPELDDPGLPYESRRDLPVLCYETEFEDGDRFFVPIHLASESDHGYWGIAPLPENFGSTSVLPGKNSLS